MEKQVFHVGAPIATQDVSEVNGITPRMKKDMSKIVIYSTRMNQTDQKIKKISSEEASGAEILYLKKKHDGKSGFNTSSIKIIEFVIVIFGTFLPSTFPPMRFLSFARFAIDLFHFFITLNSCMNFLTITYYEKKFIERY